MRQVRRGRQPATRVPAWAARQHIATLEASGLTRTTIARRAGVSAGTISRLAKPTTERASRLVIAAVLEVSTDQKSISRLEPIASVVGVSDTTVREDLSTGRKSPSSSPAPTVIKGTNGKVYQPKPQPVAASTSQGRP
jgi:lambda repressor-like predicted transcriptional regulator